MDTIQVVAIKMGAVEMDVPEGDRNLTAQRKQRQHRKFSSRLPEPYHWRQPQRQNANLCGRFVELSSGASAIDRGFPSMNLFPDPASVIV
jgi:hypothetical protein